MSHRRCNRSAKDASVEIRDKNTAYPLVVSQTWETCSGLYDNSLYELVLCLWETIRDVYKFVRNLLMSVYWTILAITVLTIFSPALLELNAKLRPLWRFLILHEQILVRLTWMRTNQAQPSCSSLVSGPIRANRVRLTWMRTNQIKPCASLGCGPIRANPCAPHLDADQLKQTLVGLTWMRTSQTRGGLQATSNWALFVGPVSQSRQYHKMMGQS